MNKWRFILLKLGSLEMTLFSLGFMMVLVFFGTLAQVHIGTFAAQQSYFNSVLVWGTPFGFRMPIFPGGLIVGTVWFVNLIAAFIVRFHFLKRNTGIIISHVGLLILLLGQFLTQTMAKESLMAIEIGKTKNYSESSRETELVFIDTSDSAWDHVVAIPYSIFSRAQQIATPHLPFKIQVRSFYENAELRMIGDNETGASSEGAGMRVGVQPRSPITTDDQPNTVTALIEIFDQGRSLGTWLLSSGLEARQLIFVGGRGYEAYLRHKRTYYPFQVTLKEFRHDRYPGTEIPKNFSSLVHLTHSDKKEDRDALIYMNHPLRYEGKTFYQSSFGKNDTLSILQVVENPFWLAPYVSCMMVVVGLLIQFLSHLVQFSRKSELK